MLPDDGDDGLLTLNFQGIDVTLQTAEDEFNAEKKTLFATYVWNGGKVLADYLISHAELVKSKTVVELGAAAGLPSIVAAKLGASFICATDYPSQSVIQSLYFNMNRNSISNAAVLPHIWGQPVDEVLASNNYQRFDVILASECLWRHESHILLLNSAKYLIKPISGKLILTYSHHIPGLEHEDDQFFEKAKSLGFEVISSETFIAPHMWNEGRTTEIYLFILSLNQ